jgi:hypothetical protein
LSPEIHDLTSEVSILCDSAILRFDISLCEYITVNVDNKFWDNDKNYLTINVTQSNPFTNLSSYVELDLHVDRRGDGQLKGSTLYGLLTLFGVFIVGILCIRFFCADTISKKGNKLY